jgi:hypothetical protein
MLTRILTFMKAAEAAALKADLSKIAGARELGEEIDALSQKRKEMSKQNLRDRHHDLGSLILALGTFTAIEGPVNTYLRAGKVHHLIATLPYFAASCT